ncbi:hypothetical protein KI387_012087, partial [Taxus chinensis]
IFKMPQERMLSHYKIDAKRQRLIVMTCHAEDMLLPQSNFTAYGYDWTRRRLDPEYMNNLSLITPNGEVDTSHLVQVSIQLNNQDNDNNGCSAKVESFKDWKKPCDFPTINPAVSGYKNRYSYVGACSGKRRTLQHFPFDTVVKLEGIEDSASTWCAGKRSFVGEPIFISRKGSSNLSAFVEDNGYILVVEYAVWEQRCYL